jgi:hypothetical protein
MNRAARKKLVKSSKKTTKTARRKQPNPRKKQEKSPAEKWRKTAIQPALADGPRDPKQPLWAPEGVDLNFVPIEIQQSINEIIKPIYEQFVVNAADGLERSLGLTLAHLLWLEVLDQFDLKREYTRIDAVLGIAPDRQQQIAQHLRLIDSKVRIGYFLLRLRELRQRLASGTPPVPREGSSQLSPAHSQFLIPNTAAIPSQKDEN